MIEVENYRRNVELFCKAIEGEKILSVVIEPDRDPTFDVNLVPFKFDYAHFVIIETESNSYRVLTSMNSEGFETFWIIDNDRTPSTEALIIFDDSVVNKVELFVQHKYAYGICLHLQATKLYLYGGEIHDLGSGKLKYVIQDEMILVFQDEQSAKRFERLAGCC